MYELARTDPRFETLRVTYRSDDLPVVAFIYKPSTTGDKRPVIVFNRGSYVRQNAAPELLVTLRRLAMPGSSSSLQCIGAARVRRVATRWAARTSRI